MASNKVCAVFGAGPGLGLSVAKHWASQGYKVAACRRKVDEAKSYENINKNITGFGVDVRNEDAIKTAVDEIESSLGPIHTMIYNVGGGIWNTYDKIDIVKFNRALMNNVTGLLVASQQVAPRMLQRGFGVIGVTGATASLRGKPFTAGFAPAKGGQRLLCQSLARDLGPKNIHVFYGIIDGVIGKGDGKIDPDCIAQVYWDLSMQPRSCWTFEFDVRPSVENW